MVVPKTAHNFLGFTYVQTFIIVKIWLLDRLVSILPLGTQCCMQIKRNTKATPKDLFSSLSI